MVRRLIQRIRQEPFLWSALAIAAIVYCLISFVNHYCFRSYTLDLGAYTNALYDYAQFSWNDSSSFNATPENLLADHFDLYLPLVSPLVWIFGTYTLLVVQLIAVLIGAAGVYRYFRFRFPESRTARFALVYFLAFFAIFAAFSFDYHSSVVAAMIVPWLLLAFQKRQFRRIVVLTLLILAAKENMALWVIFIGFGLFILHFRDKRLRWLALGMSAFSVVYFLIILEWVMPALSYKGVYPHFDYSVLGKSSGEALKYLLSHPIDSFLLLFRNHSGLPANDFVKAEFWIIFACCGIFCLRKPVYLLMLVPIIAQKMFSDKIGLWAANHYAIELAPILAIGSFEAIATFRNVSWRKAASYTAAILSVACTIRIMDHTVFYAEKSRIRVYKSAHYSREFPIARAYDVLEKIPDDAVVSAQSAFVPHLSLRESAYQFPIIRDAEYILLSPVENPYPIDSAAFRHKKDSLLENREWEPVVNDAFFLLLKKIKR